MDKHTEEPWDYVFEHSIYEGYHEPDSSVEFEITFTAVSEANAKRIVDCVNALSGIEDPQKWVEEMKAGVTIERFRAKEIEDVLRIAQIIIDDARAKTAPGESSWTKRVKACREYILEKLNTEPPKTHGK